MCGRFYVDDEMVKEIEGIVGKLQRKIRAGKENGCENGVGFAGAKRTGDIFPSQKSIVLMEKDSGLRMEEMQWGFPQYNRKGLLINARAETVLERYTFRDSVQKRRCVIPARKFYEWDREKNKVTFGRENSRVLYMAGIYREFDMANHFCIITTQANTSVMQVHDRMPLILEEEEVERWIQCEDCLELVLGKVPASLSHYQEYQQQRLVLE